jgi:hypothetical protein
MRRLLPLIACLAASRLFAQDIRITEFLPTNTAGIQDEDATFQGWIEIWNPSKTSRVSINGWKLVQGANQWTFPAVELPPEDFLLIFASGKNRNVSSARLHTNFTLDPTGATALQLVRSNTTVASEFTSYPALAANVSYGRDLADSSQVGSYTTPTPENANNYTGTGVSGKVTFSLTSRAFTGSLSLSLSTTAVGATIRFTTNGTAPTSSSAVYSVPLTISSTTLVRARIFETGKLPGEIEGESYLLLDANTSAFTSPMPICVISNFGAGTPPDNSSSNDQPCFMWVFQPGSDGLSRLTNLPVLYTRGAIDRRGRSTIGNPKWNLNFEARKGRDDFDRNISLLNMPSESDWVFHAPYDFDRALIRNPLVFALSNAVGRYAPRTRMAEVFVDSDGGALTFTNSGSGNYFGIYNVLEKIRRGSDRVDVLSLGTYDNDAIRKTGGYIWKRDDPDLGDSGFSAGGQSLVYYYPNELAVKSTPRDPQEQHLTSYINSFKTALDSASYRDPIVGYAAWIDVAAAIDHHLINVWPMNVDALRLSGYWHKERGGKMVAGPVWDFDRCMDSTDGRDDNPNTWRSTVSDFGTDFFNYTWWGRLFTDPDFYQRYIDRWFELRRGAFSTTAFNALVDELNNALAPVAITRDLARWGQSKRNYTSGGTTFTGQAAEILRVKEWMANRAAFMESQWVAPVAFNQASGTISPGLSLAMSGPSGATIYYTLDGTDPRPSGGGVPSAANVFTYSAPIAINSTTRVKARAYHPTWTALTGANNPPLVSKWSGLTSARYSTDQPASASNLSITEINYNPVAPTAAELAINPAFSGADFEFIELKNTSGTPVDLGGMRFAVGIDFSFTENAAMTLAPGAFAIVAADPSAFTARYGSIPNVIGPFTGDLDGGGEPILLLSATNAPIRDFTYDDAWYPTTDGGGRTLAIYRPFITSPSASTDWRASAALGGSPGADEPNQAPSVITGATIVGTLPSIALAPPAYDDGLPSNALTFSWSKVSGPGSVTFSSPTQNGTDATFTLPGVYNLRLTVSDSLLNGSGDLNIVMRDTPGQWLLRNPGIGTLNDDPDGDGKTNFFEWALVLNPTQPTGSDGTTYALENGRLTLTYSRQKNSPFVTYTVQATSDLSAWSDPLPGQITESILSDDGLIQTVKATDSSTGSPERFIRLKITPQ